MLYRAASIAVIAALGLAIVPASGEDRMVLGPRQFQADGSGAGAVLCTWSLYLTIQALSATCELPRQPIDTAIDRAIADIDDFIIANSSLHPGRAALDRFKRDAAERERAGAVKRGLDSTCKSGDLTVLRSVPSASIEASVKALLATPREPVMNPCL